MAFMLLIVEPPDQRREVGREEGERRYARMLDFAKDLKGRGKLIRTESLTSQTDGVRISKRSGKTSMIDGPFAEAKEMVGGFFLVDCDSREEAIAIAQACPAAEWSTVEVRPLGPCFVEAD